MIACVSPASTSADHTLNTLRYADRLKGKRKEDEMNFSVSKSVEGEEDKKIFSENLRQKYMLERKNKVSKSISEKVLNLSEEVNQSQNQIK